MRFRLLGIPVEIQLGFWLMAAALGFPLLRQEHKGAIAVWVGVVLVSILVHELGHAIAIVRYGGQPSITLYVLGGLTAWARSPNITRVQRIIVSASGPGAGFLLAALVYGVVRALPEADRPLPFYLTFTLQALLEVNIGWGIFNLVPVLPFDGGNILLEALGPKRLRTTAYVSMITGAAIALLFLAAGHIWITFLVGMGAVQSFQRLRAEADAVRPAEHRAARSPGRDEEPADGAEVRSTLAAAKEALQEDQYDQAIRLCEAVLAARPSPRTKLETLHVLGWSLALADRISDAAGVLSVIEQEGEIDKALAATVLRAGGRVDVARKLLEAARAEGDDRREVVGPLIQILIEQGEVARASAIALDIVGTLSDEDARKMGEIACDAKAYEWASRLREAVFDRTGAADDAYHAARARALEGDRPAALDLLRRAVAAGFSDAKRAWSDGALEPLRDGGELEALLPRPSSQ